MLEQLVTIYIYDISSISLFIRNIFVIQNEIVVDLVL